MLQTHDAGVVRAIALTIAACAALGAVPAAATARSCSGTSPTLLQQAPIRLRHATTAASTPPGSDGVLPQDWLTLLTRSKPGTEKPEDELFQDWLTS